MYRDYVCDDKIQFCLAGIPTLIVETGNELMSNQVNVDWTMESFHSV